MARKRHTAEEIVAKLRQVDVLMAQGKPVADAVRAIGGVPGGWVSRSGILGTVEALVDCLGSQVVGALKALRVVLAGLASWPWSGGIKQRGNRRGNARAAK